MVEYGLVAVHLNPDVGVSLTGQGSGLVEHRLVGGDLLLGWGVEILLLFGFLVVTYIESLPPDVTLRCLVI